MTNLNGESEKPALSPELYKKMKKWQLEIAKLFAEEKEWELKLKTWATE